MKPLPFRPPLAALVPAPPLEFGQALSRVRTLGFTHADVVGLAERPAAHLEALAESDLLVACGIIGYGLAEALTLDAPAIGDRRAALEEMKRQITDVARLGATHAALVSGRDGSAPGLVRFTDACRLLADHAAGRMVRLCIGHVPGRALPTAAAVLRWLEEAGQDNLWLLLNVGPCFLGQEDPAEVIRQAGARLGYVRIDDPDELRVCSSRSRIRENSGWEGPEFSRIRLPSPLGEPTLSDRHVSLLTGPGTRTMLQATLAALGRGGYDGAVEVAWNAGNPEPLEALRRGKVLLEELLQATQEGPEQ